MSEENRERAAAARPQTQCPDRSGSANRKAAASNFGQGISGAPLACVALVRNVCALAALGLLLIASPVHAASLTGTVSNDAGDPLVKVPVCLRKPDTERICLKIRSTDRNGKYQFTGLKPGVSYRVSVFQDDTASGRKYERYRTYVWEPLYQDVALLGKSESVGLEGFIGKFNFSNFQRGLTLTAADFPELSSLDLAADYVVLKVFFTASDPTTPPNTIYLGRVAQLDNFQIVASLPLSATRIDYQVYAANLSIDGSISLAER